MAKGGRGLPPGFDLDIGGDAPVKLGDYLDEETSIPVIPRRPAPARVEKSAPKPEAKVQARGEEVRGVAPAKAAMPSIEPPTPPAPLAVVTQRLRKPPRREVNLRPDTQRMFDELIEYVRAYSAEPHATASEVFHALVTVLYQAKEDVDLRHVPRRGKWGSVTAKSFPDALANAFAEGISRRAGKLNAA